MHNFLNIFKIPDLRKRILFILFVLVIYRIGSYIPISGIDINQLNNLFNTSGFLGFVDLFSGGALSRFSIFALGILPYINASIIMHLMAIVWPKLKELAEEGEAGRKKIAQYTRYLTVIIAFVQGFVMSLSFRSFILPDVSVLWFVSYSIVGLVAGATFVMWLGELVTIYGIGNGASLLIFIGIIARMPFYIKNTAQLLVGGVSWMGVAIMILVLLGIIVSIVYIQEAIRKIPIQYAKRIVGRRMMGGQNTFIPLRLIQGGVLPIIFASAILQFPLMFSQYINLNFVQNFFAVYYRYDGFLYNFLFCFLIFFFTYFYTAITFNPKELADNIKKYGGFILGVRPGRPTVEYLEKIISKLTLIGASFLAFIALVPIVAANVTKVNSFMGLGGTALLIIVGVAMDLVKQIEAYLINRRYEGLIE